jgi:hypothetical protein
MPSTLLMNAMELLDKHEHLIVEHRIALWHDHGLNLIHIK